MEPAPFWPGIGLLVLVLKVPGCSGDSAAGAVLGASEVGRGAPPQAALPLTVCMVAGGHHAVLL